MKLIAFNKIGKIIAGDEIGGFIKIIDNSENTGGYYILFCDSIDFLCVYDSWVKNQEDLNKYFEESKWIIEWIG